jgi:hypothetical protein
MDSKSEHLTVGFLADKTAGEKVDTMVAEKVDL